MRPKRIKLQYFLCVNHKQSNISRSTRSLRYTYENCGVEDYDDNAAFPLVAECSVALTSSLVFVIKASI